MSEKCSNIDRNKGLIGNSVVGDGCVDGFRGVMFGVKRRRDMIV